MKINKAKQSNERPKEKANKFIYKRQPTFFRLFSNDEEEKKKSETLE